MNKLQHTATRMLLMAMALQGIAAVAGEIPVQLPKPDGKPGEATKPVKVYLLAGQSNMNGMGDLNRALGFDFRPPSSGRTQPANQFESLEYKLMVKGVRETLDKIDKVVPGYQGQGYEIAGFCWFQGHKDSGAPKAEYEKHLVNLINDLRKEFNVPKMPAVVATVGFNGYNMADNFKTIWAAQMAVGDPKQHPEFVGTVASVDTRDFWREVEESPRWQDYHYNRNAETYMLVGESMGRAMVRLLGGEAEAIPKSDREARVVAETVAQAAKPVPTAEQKAASLAALKPMILDGALAAFVNSPRYQPELKAAVKGEKPARVSPLLNDTMDEAVAYYLPPFKEGHRYRIRIGGSAHNNMGEGYAIYVNGGLLAESRSGIVAWRREGGRPRGGHVYPEFCHEFKGGKVTLAVSNFPMDNRPIEALIPPGDTLSVWMEEMNLPPLE